MSYTELTTTVPTLLDPSDSIKVVEVAKKYGQLANGPNASVPDYAPPGETRYHCTQVDRSWTQGFLPGMIWLLEERRRLSEACTAPEYSADDFIRYARHYQKSFEHMAADAYNHDQGFRFQLSYGKDLELTSCQHARTVVITAADTLLRRYDPAVGCVRSWDTLWRPGEADIYRKDNMDEHYLVIIDNMMNLDILYLASELTGDRTYGDMATRQAWKSIKAFIRPDYTTHHVVDLNRDGTVKRAMTHQGYSDQSTWSRGQAWGMYGFAQCGESEFIKASRGLTDKFIELLDEQGVPQWDFDAPRPCPLDASAGLIAARAMQMLDSLLSPDDPVAAEGYRRRAFELVRDTLRICRTGQASLRHGKVSWGEDGWETILKHSTSNGSPRAVQPRMDHGLVYADYYLMEFGNEALKGALSESDPRSHLGHA